ncbi:MAG: DUF1217 domain-containing protein [Proteobacteria bacterium]|nr:DUF1217 domain-containing protein [Pseudomonadota bacterium]
MTSLTSGQIALSVFGLSPTTGSLNSPGFPGGPVAYYNYLAKNGANLLVQSNKSQKVAGEVAYFQSRTALTTPSKATTTVRISANLPSTDLVGGSRTVNATVYDGKSDKFTVQVKFTNLGVVGTTQSWAAQIVSASAVAGNPNNLTASVTAGNQVLTFDTTTGAVTGVSPGPGSTTSGVKLGVIATSDNQLIQPVFSFSGGGTTGGNLTDTNGAFLVNAVQSDGNAAVAGTNNIKTVADVFKDQRLLNFILTATGLGDQTQAIGLVKKALTQDPTKPGAIVNQLPNKKFLAADQTLQLYNGLDTLQSAATIQSLITNFQQNTFEQNIAQTDQSVANARYFAKNIAATVTSASTTTNAIFGILGDSVLREVVTTALGFPKQLAVLPVQNQAADIASRLNVNQFKNPTFVAQFVTRYLTQVQNSQFQADLGGGSGDIALASLFR